MGANAVTTVPVYTAGEVLTASDLNITNSGIPVFASTVERDAAFGGTGEKTLAEGQFAYLETGNVTQYYDGAAWQPVGVAPGLVFITGASFTSVASVSMATGVFTSTYKTYRVEFQTVGSASVNINMRVNDAGTPVTTANYERGISMVNISGGSSFDGATNGTSLPLVATAPTSPFPAYSSITIYDPANASSNTGATIMNFGSIAGVSGTGGLSMSGLRFKINQAHDGLTFIATTGNITGFYRVYALTES